MRYTQVVLTLLMSALLAACVTKETGVFTGKANEQKALQQSVQLARSYIRDGNWDAAKRHLKNALKLNDSDAEVHEALALVFQNTGELELADQHFQRAIRLDSTLSRARNNYAVFLFQQERYADAEQQLVVVAEDVLYEQRSAAFVNLGRCRVKLKDFTGADEAFSRAQLMERANPIIAYELAEVQFELQQYPAAQRNYDFYRSRVKVQTPRALWLGIRLAKQYGDHNAEASYALALKNLYPKSKEYFAYRKGEGES